MEVQKVTKKVDLTEYIQKHGFNIGLKIPPGSYVEVTGVQDEETGEPLPFHITNACLGPDAQVDDRAILTFTDLDCTEANEIVCASLRAGVNENVILDMVVHGDCIIGNPSAIQTSIHLLGRISAGEDAGEEEDGEWEGEEDDEDDDDDDFDEDEGGEMYIDDEDEDDEDYDDEDDEDYDEYDDVPPSRVTIEQLPSDDEEEKANGHADKRPKLTTDKKKKNATEGSADTSAKKADKKKPTEKATKTQAAVKKEEPAKAEKKKESTKATPVAKSHDASKTVTDPKVAAEAVMTFIKEELKKAKVVKGTDLGTAIVNKFKIPLKKMGFEEKTLVNFVEARGKDEIQVTNDTFKLK